jgi:hypothetical protein
MKQRPRIHYTNRLKALMWERWRQGDSLQKIAQLFGQNHAPIRQTLAATAGVWPGPRCRRSLALTLAEREEISRSMVEDSLSSEGVKVSPLLVIVGLLLGDEIGRPMHASLA